MTVKFGWRNDKKLPDSTYGCHGYVLGLVMQTPQHLAEGGVWHNVLFFYQTVRAKNWPTASLLQPLARKPKVKKMLLGDKLRVMS